MPLPERESAIKLSHRLLRYWPVWDLQERIEKDGITINRARLRRGWVTLELDWWGAESAWSANLDPALIRDVIAMAANEADLYFHHWEVIKPKLTDAPREAIVYFRTEMKHPPSVGELLTYVKREEVNTIILANSFSLMEKDGIEDQD